MKASFLSSLEQSWQRFSKQRYSYTLLSRNGHGFLSSRRGHFLLVSTCASLLLIFGLCALGVARSAPTASTSDKKLDPEPVHIERPVYLPVQDDDEATFASYKNERYAYVTWLSNTVAGSNQSFATDVYFTATRVLVWQLLHDPATKTTGIDVVVMCGPHVDEAHQERLRKDGAIVRPVELVHGQNDTWIVPKESRWADIMGKLRAWELEEYSAVLMLDGDMVLQYPLDGIFHDPGVRVMRTKPNVTRLSDEPDLPDEYLLSAYQEIGFKEHDWPPTDNDHHKPGYFNGGFFMLKPDKKLFNYFVGLLDLVDRFDPRYMEQNLLNYAFRWDGAMPWREVADTWNIKFTNEADMDGGVISMHEKFWKTRSGGNQLKEFLCSKRWQMEGYYLGREESES